jgi:hypothetical protein
MSIDVHTKNTQDTIRLAKVPQRANPMQHRPSFLSLLTHQMRTYIVNHRSQIMIPRDVESKVIIL